MEMLQNNALEKLNNHSNPIVKAGETASQKMMDYIKSSL